LPLASPTCTMHSPPGAVQSASVSQNVSQMPGDVVEEPDETQSKPAAHWFEPPQSSVGPAGPGVRQETIEL